MTTTYAGRSNGALGRVLVSWVAGALGLLISFYVGIVSAVGIFSLSEYEPLQSPSPPASANLTPSGFAPTWDECPPVGECPYVNIVVRKDDAIAFHRHLRLVALNHGGDYTTSLPVGFGLRRNVYTIRLPQEAARELQLMSVNGYPGFFSAPYVSPGYRQWVARWSGKRASTLHGGPDALATMRVFVQGDHRGAYYIGAPLMLGIGAFGLCLMVVARMRRRA